MAAAAYNSYIYLSTNFGTSFTQTGAVRAWESIATNGQVVTSVVNAGGIWTSNNFGSTYTQVTSAPTANWYALRCDPTGQICAAAVYANSGSPTGIYATTAFSVSGPPTTQPTLEYVLLYSLFV